METPWAAVFFTKKEKFSFNFQSRHADDLFPMAGYSHQESHSARRSLVPSEDLGALSPPFPVETSPQPCSTEQPPTNHLILFN